jgi:hypothetical protein
MTKELSKNSMGDKFNENPNSNKIKLTTTQIILIFGIVLIIVVLAVVGVVVSKTMQAKTSNVPIERISGKGTVITEDNVNEDNKPVANELFTVAMNNVWQFEKGSTPSLNAYVQNHESNTRPFFIEVLEGDPQKLIYTSPVVPVGSTLKEMVLDVPLKKGTYEAVCSYNLLDEDENVTSTVSFAVSIIVNK